MQKFLQTLAKIPTTTACIGPLCDECCSLCHNTQGSKPRSVGATSFLTMTVSKTLHSRLFPTTMINSTDALLLSFFLKTCFLKAQCKLAFSEKEWKQAAELLFR
jgi:hypothetical protein